MKKTQTGLTMVELLITLSIVGIMTTILVPPMTDLVESSQVKNDTANLYSSLLLARSASVTRNSMVSLCKIDPSSPTVCDNSKGWQSGWIVFEDSDNDGVRDVGEDIINTSTGLGRTTTVTATNYTNVLSYLPSGGITTNGSFNICVNGEVANSIFVNGTGRPRTAESSCS